jgi:hypothetical protein
MQIAFVTSKSVTMQTPLGRTILQTAAKQNHIERLAIAKRIRIIEANRASQRFDHDAIDGHDRLENVTHGN